MVTIKEGLTIGGTVGNYYTGDLRSVSYFTRLSNYINTLNYWVEKRSTLLSVILRSPWISPVAHKTKVHPVSFCPSIS